MKLRVILFSLFLICILFQSSVKAQESKWGGYFCPPGVEGTVLALEHWGDSLVVGGDFNSLGSSNYGTLKLAIYDKIDRSWRTVEDGPILTQEIRAFAVLPSGDLLVGGFFNFFIDGKTIQNLGVYTRSGTWTTLSGENTDGVNGPVNALLAHNENIYIGGEFTRFQSQYFDNFVIWNNDSGLVGTDADFRAFRSSSATINDFAVQSASSDKIFIGGDYRYVTDSTECTSLLIYDITNHELIIPGNYPEGRVHALYTDTTSFFMDKLAIGGDFNTVSTGAVEPDSVQNFYFSNLTGYISSTPVTEINGPIYDMERHFTSDFRFVIGGAFDSINTNYTGSLAYYNITFESFTSFGADISNGVVHSLSKNAKYVGGDFKYLTDSSMVNSVIQTDSYLLNNWKTLGSGLLRNGSVTKTQVSDVHAVRSGDFYAVGNFDYAGGRKVNYVGFWDGATWHSLGSGVNDSLSELHVNGDTVYVAGPALDSASGIPVNQIAMWDGSTWHPLGDGVPDANILDMEIDNNGILYVCGEDLITAGSASVTGIAMWNGSTWSAVGDTITNSSIVKVIIFDMYYDDVMNHLYICGQFDNIGGIPSYGVAYWDGINWNRIGHPELRLGTSYSPKAIARNPEGNIIVYGTNSTSQLRYRDEIQDTWPSYYHGDFNSYPQAMFVRGCDLFVAGDAMRIDGDVGYNDIVRWDGLEWFHVDSGVYRDALAMSSYSTSNELVVGGNFTRAGEKITTGLAVWSGLRNPNTEAGLVVHTPNASDSLKHGDVYLIEWDTTAVVEDVALEISTDSAKTWQLLENKIDAKVGRFPFLIPNSNYEYCKLRISDALAPCVYDETGFFKIYADSTVDVTWLTRPNSSLYPLPFTIGIHNWSFSNSGVYLWPDSIVDIISYPDDFPFIPDTVKNFPDWDSFVKAFGVDYCYQNGNIDNIQPSAIVKWKNSLMKWAGSCFGFSHSSFLWWKFNAFNSGIFIPDSYLFDFELDDFERNSVNLHWIFQKGRKHIEHGKDVIEFSPIQTVQTIRESFINNDPRSISFSWRTWKDKTDTSGIVTDSIWRSVGHNVSPYAIVNFEDSNHIYHIYVYDSNTPNNKSRYMRVDSLNSTWSFDAYGIPDTTGRFIPRLPITEYIGLASDDRNSSGFLKSAASEFNFITTSATEEITISDSLGKQVGWLDNNPVVTMTNAGVIYPEEPDYPYNYPQGYYLPQTPVQIDISNFESTETFVGYESGNKIYTYERIGTKEFESDQILVSSSIDIINPDTSYKTISLTSIDKDSITNTQLYVKIDSLILAENDSISLEIDSIGIIHLKNYGEAKKYSFILWHSGLDTTNYTQSLTTIDLTTNTNQIIAPDWQNLESGMVEIYLDSDQNGIYEDTVIADVATDVKNDLGLLLPEQFILTQNYPNPFNPTTTIKFSIPTRAEVTLEVINIIGQRVKTLYSGNLAAGEYQVDWNGNNESNSKVGSGVYFYRLTANDFVSTKKMLLLK